MGELRLVERLSDHLWTPAPSARGPHLGVQGGILGALLCAVAEEAVGAEYAPRSIAVQFIRVVALDEMRTSVSVIHKGRRSAVCDAALYQNDRLLTRATVTFTTTVPIPFVPDAPETHTDPATFTMLEPYGSHGYPWHDEVLEKAIAPDGSYWYRTPWCVTGTESRFAHLLQFADWSPGLSRLDDWRQPLFDAFPNIDFTAHADREPESDWIGMRPGARWRPSGSGIVFTDLCDLRGELGRFTSTLILLPHAEPKSTDVAGRPRAVVQG
jgi:acyl-coenzyme A thioesterase PaaI-like protein